MRSVVRAKPFFTPMHRDRLPACSCRHVRVDGLQRPSGRNASPQRGTPSTIMSPTRSQPGPWTEIRLGVRAHPPLSSASTAPVKRYALGPQGRPPGDRAPPLALEGSQVRGRARTETQQHLGRLTRVPCTDKEQSWRAAWRARSLLSRTNSGSGRFRGSADERLLLSAMTSGAATTARCRIAVRVPRRGRQRAGSVCAGAACSDPAAGE
jgi:hypothetical protein